MWVPPWGSKHLAFTMWIDFILQSEQNKLRQKHLQCGPSEGLKTACSEATEPFSIIYIYIQYYILIWYFIIAYNDYNWQLLCQLLHTLVTLVIRRAVETCWICRVWSRHTFGYPAENIHSDLQVMPLGACQSSIQLAQNNFSGFPGCTKFSRCSKASPETSRQNFSHGYIVLSGFYSMLLASLQALLVSYLQFPSFLSPGPKYRVPPGGSRPARTESKAYTEWYTMCGVRYLSEIYSARQGPATRGVAL